MNAILKRLLFEGGVSQTVLKGPENPVIKRWLLREGFRNSVMYEYLAATCARAGGLLAALGDDDVDRELLTGAGEILQALIAGRPGPLRPAAVAQSSLRTVSQRSR